MKASACWFGLVFGLLTAACAAGTVGAESVPSQLDGVPVLNGIPTTWADFERRAHGDASLVKLVRNGESLNGVMQTLLTGETLPLGPAPHIPWARPLPGGPLRLTVFSVVNNNYDIAELERRIDCRIRHIRSVPQYGWPRDVPEVFAGYLSDRALETLAKPADVILVDQSIRLLRPEVSDALLRKVREEGCGLVVFGGARLGGGKAYEFWPTADKIPVWLEFSKAFLDQGQPTGNFVTLSSHAVTAPGPLFSGLAFDWMPEYHVFPVKAAAGATVIATDGDCPLALTRELGKGRAMLTTWVAETGAFPYYENAAAPRMQEYQEYYSTLLARAILWAARRESPLQLSLAQTHLAAGQPNPVTIAVARAGKDRGWGTRATVMLRELSGRTIWQKDVSAGAAAVTVELPSLVVGEVLLDVIVRDRKGASLGFANFPLRVTGDGELTVTTTKDRYLPGEAIEVEAAVTGLGGAAITADLELTDTFGRLLFQQTVSVTEGKARWSYPNTASLTVLHTARVTICRDGNARLRKEIDVYVPRYQPEDLTNWLWPGTRPMYAQKRIWGRMREIIGFDVIMAAGLGGTTWADNRNMVASGAIPFWSNIAPQSPNETERNPQGARAHALDMVASVSNQLHRLGGLAMFLQDERHASQDCGTPTPEALASFRQYLATQYATIADLNRTWEATFPGFESVVPELTAGINPARNSMAPWLDWRRWALHEVVGIDRAVVGRIRESAGVPCNIGLEGIFPWEGGTFPYGGLDLAAQTIDCFNIAGPYTESYLNAYQSLYSGFLMSWSGYFYPYPVCQRYVWAGAFQGYGGLGWWYDPIWYNAYDVFHPQAVWVKELTAPIRNGVGKLIMENRPADRAPVAFLYSLPSVYAMTLLGKKIDPSNVNLLGRPANLARESLQRMFQDAGIQPTWLTEQQLQKNTGEGIKLLVLSSCVALEPATCAAIRTFVERGGTVLADLAPGMWDDHGGYHSPGQLDALFGVSHGSGVIYRKDIRDYGILVSEDDPDFNIKNQWFINQFIESSLQVAGGRALGKCVFGTPVPAFVVNRLGKGKTILMNFLETEYGRTPENWQLTLAKELVYRAGLEAPFAMYDTTAGGALIETGRKLFQWTDGSVRYYGVLLDKGARVQFEFKQRAHVYELSRGGIYLGNTNQVALDMIDKPHALFALLPYRVTGLALTGDKASLAGGLPLAVELKTDGKPVTHVVHLEVLRPDGTAYYGLTRNVVLKDGKWSGRLPLALNDPIGRWTLRACDVTSGQTATLRVRVSR